MRYTLFLILFFIILLYPLNMSIDTWGMLPKSQEDNETIEEAINRIVAEHEADPEAHTGENESLAAHREFETLDHKAGSVLADKLTDKEMMWESNLSDYALWTSFDIDNENYPGIGIPYNADNHTYARMTINLQSIVAYNLPLTIDYYFQAYGFGENPPGSSVFDFGFGVYGTTTSDGFGFKAVHDQCSVYFKIGANVNTANIATFTDGKKHVFRAMYTAVNSTVYFFVDGQLVGSLVKPSGTPSSGLYFGYRFYIDSYAGEAYKFYQVRVTAVGGYN
jgi:hypothetical protein